MCCVVGVVLDVWWCWVCVLGFVVGVGCVCGVCWWCVLCVLM